MRVSVRVCFWMGGCGRECECEWVGGCVWVWVTSGWVRVGVGVGVSERERVGDTVGGSCNDTCA